MKNLISFKKFNETLNQIETNTPPQEQLHVFDFDDTLGVTQNANGVMLYRSGKPVHQTKEEALEWVKSMGVHQDEFLEPYVKEIIRKDGDKGWAVYVNSAALSTIQKYYKYPTHQTFTSTDDPESTLDNPEDTLFIDFSPSGKTCQTTTKPITKTINKLKRVNQMGADSIVITARKGEGKMKDFEGNYVQATNSKDITNYLKKFGAQPKKGVIGVVGANKGEKIEDIFINKNPNPPDEIHFYDDSSRNVTEVENEIGGEQDLYIYGPGHFDKGEADAERPTKKINKVKIKRK